VTTATARVRAARPAAPATDRPSLRVVAARPLARLPRLPFALLVGAVLSTGLVALLLLHTMAAQDAFRLHDLQRQAATLQDTEQQLSAAGQQLSAPGTLAARARALGMVPTSGVSFVRLRNGRVVGVAHATPVLPAPATSASTSPQPSASATPRASASAAPAAAKPAARHHPRPSPTPSAP